MALFGNKKDKQDKPGFLDRMTAGLKASFADDDFEETSAPSTGRRNATASTGEYLVGDRVTVSWNRFSPEQLVTISIYAKDDDLLRRVVEEGSREDVMVTGANIDGFNCCLMEAVLFNQAILALDMFEAAVRAGKANSKSAEYVVVFADVDGNPTTQEAPPAIAEEFADKMQYIRESRPDEFQQLDSKTLLPEKPKMSKKFGKGGGPSKKSGDDKDEDKGEMSAVGKRLLNFGDFWQLVLDTAKDESFNRTDAKNIVVKMMKIFNQTGGFDLWQTTKPEWDALMKRATDAEAKATDLEAERDDLKGRVEHQSEKIEQLAKELDEAKKSGSGEPEPKPAEPEPGPDGPKPRGGWSTAKAVVEMLQRRGIEFENMPERLRNANPGDKFMLAEVMQMQAEAVKAQEDADHPVDSADDLEALLAKYGI